MLTHTVLLINEKQDYMLLASVLKMIDRCALVAGKEPNCVP